MIRMRCHYTASFLFRLETIISVGNILFEEISSHASHVNSYKRPTRKQSKGFEFSKSWKCIVYVTYFVILRFSLNVYLRGDFEEII